MMSKTTKAFTSTFKKVLLIPLLTIPALLFSAETGAQDSLKTSELNNDELWNSLSHLNIESHPEEENVAVLKLFLKEDSPVLFQLFINQDTLSIVDKSLPAGDHSIYFDYSSLKSSDVDFLYKFEIGDDMDMELNGPFLEDGKLFIQHKDMYKP